MIMYSLCAITIAIIVGWRFYYLQNGELYNPYWQAANNLILSVVYGLCALSIHLLHDNFPTKNLIIVMVIVFIIAFICDLVLKNLLLRSKK